VALVCSCSHPHTEQPPNSGEVIDAKWSNDELGLFVGNVSAQMEEPVMRGGLSTIENEMRHTPTN